MDFIMNGQAQGTVASRLLESNMDVNVLRPWVGQNGRHYVNHKGVAVPLTHATATLRREEWMQIDEAVTTAAKARLRVVNDIRGAGLTYNVPNAFGKTVLESATMGDITPAIVSMEPARRSEGDRPEFDVAHTPLPIIHKDFQFTARQIAVSRNSSNPLDTTMITLAGRKVAEEAEKLVLGLVTPFGYGGGTLYGLTNFPQRITKVLTNPTDSGWTPQVLVNELLDMRQKANDIFQYGPWFIYVSPAWAMYLDNDYSAAKGDNTLRQRITAIDGLGTPVTVDYLTGFQILLVQKTAETIRIVTGMDITTVQWDTDGGMVQNFKVMAMIVPQIRADNLGQTGIVHGTAPA